MLASKFRLKGKTNFARVELGGKLVQSKSFGLGIYDRGDNQATKFGFIISTKVSKKAISRNRIKRITADTVRRLLSNFRNGLDVVFLFKSNATKTSKKELEDEITKLLTQNLQK